MAAIVWREVREVRWWLFGRAAPLFNCLPCAPLGQRIVLSSLSSLYSPVVDDTTGGDRHRKEKLTNPLSLPAAHRLRLFDEKSNVYPGGALVGCQANATNFHASSEVKLKGLRSALVNGISRVCRRLRFQLLTRKRLSEELRRKRSLSRSLDVFLSASPSTYLTRFFSLPPFFFAPRLPC